MPDKMHPSSGSETPATTASVYLAGLFPVSLHPNPSIAIPERLHHLSVFGLQMLLQYL